MVSLWNSHFSALTYSLWCSNRLSSDLLKRCLNAVKPPEVFLISRVKTQMRAPSGVDVTQGQNQNSTQ